MAKPQYCCAPGVDIYNPCPLCVFLWSSLSFLSQTAGLTGRAFRLALRLGGLALCHHPRPVAGAYTLAGHWHPCAPLGGRAHDRLRLPCFWLGAEAHHPVGVLPAFGGFTGMHPIERRAGDRVFVLTEDRVAELPRGGAE